MQIRCKFGQLGQGRGQFNAPHGFCLGGRDEEIVVADTHNHRIQVANPNKEYVLILIRRMYKTALYCYCLLLQYDSRYSTKMVISDTCLVLLGKKKVVCGFLAKWL